MLVGRRRLSDALVTMTNRLGLANAKPIKEVFKEIKLWVSLSAGS